MAKSPVVILYDSAGVAMAVENGVATPANTKGVIVAGVEGANTRFMRTASDGTVRIDPSGTTTQPISAAALPLPAGAATEATVATLSTEAKLEAVRALLATIDADTSTLAAVDYATQTTLEAARVLLASLDGKDFATQTTLAAILVDTGQMEALLTTIDADTSALAGVDYATSAKQDTIIGHIDLVESLLAGIDAVLDNIYVRQTDRSQRSIVSSGAKGTAVAADITSSPLDANTEALHADVQSSVFDRDRDRIFYAEIRALGVAATTFYLLIDLDGNPKWKHTNGSKLSITNIRGATDKSNAGAKWIVRVGVVTRIDGTDADVIYFVNAGMTLLDTSILSVDNGLSQFFPVFVPIEVVSEEIPKLVTDGKFTGEAMDSSTAIADAAGTTTVPEVGDLVVKADLISGGGTLDFGFSVGYAVDP